MKAHTSVEVDQSSPYRWVVVVVTAILVATSFIALTSFGVAAPNIAASLHVPTGTVTTYGIDSFSIGLFAAFFLGHNGIFDTRPRLGVLVAQLFLIVPQFLIPIVSTLWLLTILRFSQGLVIMMLAVFSVQLAGWFKPTERAWSLALPMGALVLGGALGGILFGDFQDMPWRNMYDLSGFIMLLGAMIYFIFSRNAPSQQVLLQQTKQSGEAHSHIFRRPMTWIMGLVQIPLNWAVFSIGGFLPAYGFHLGYSANQVGTMMTVWGVSGFCAALIGASLGDYWAKKQSDRESILRARLRVITIANVCMGIGAILIFVFGHMSYAWLLVAVIINAMSIMIPPNYWATPGVAFPLSLMGAGAFGMGLISNTASAIGPLVSSFLVPNLGWDGVFVVIAILAVVGIVINIQASRMRLDSTQNSYVQNTTQL